MARETKIQKRMSLMGILRKHVGHTIRFHSNGEKTGKILRMNEDASLVAMKIWVEAKPFPIVIFDDQILGCDDCDKPREWQWSDDSMG